MSVKFVVQADWDGTGEWKDFEDFSYEEEARQFCQSYDSQNRDPEPMFRVVKVESKVVWQEGKKCTS